MDLNNDGDMLCNGCRNPSAKLTLTNGGAVCDSCLDRMQRCSNCGFKISKKLHRDIGSCPKCGNSPSITPFRVPLKENVEVVKREAEDDFYAN